MATSKIINLSHIKADKDIPSKKAQNLTSKINLSSLEEISEESTCPNVPTNKMINLSHVSTNMKMLTPPYVSVSTVPPDEGVCFESSDGIPQEEALGNIISRLRPNSTFLRRYVGGMEKSNEKLPIVAPVLETTSGNVSEDKANVIQELKDAAMERLRSQPKSLEDMRSTPPSSSFLSALIHPLVEFQMEGELKIQQLAQLHCLSVQVTYLPFPDSRPVATTKPRTTKGLTEDVIRRKSLLKKITERTLRNAPPQFDIASAPETLVTPIVAPKDASPAKEPKPTIAKRKLTLDLSSSRASIILKAIGQKRQPPSLADPPPACLSVEKLRHSTQASPVADPLAPETVNEERPAKKCRVLTSPDTIEIGVEECARKTTPPQRQKEQQPPRKLFLSAFSSLGKDRGQKKTQQSMPPSSQPT